MDRLKIVAVSDLHFGHNRLPAEELYGKLHDYLYPQLEGAHMLIIAGDIYHDITTVSSKTHQYVTMFMKDLANIAVHTGMVIRVLHGTFSHDRGQLSILKNYISTDLFVVVDDVAVETVSLAGHSLTIGYLPDNLPYKKSTDAMSHLKDLMKIHAMPKLHLVIGHGDFMHVLPENSASLPPCLYDLSQFKGVADYLIFGHHHIPSKKGNMVYCGSFDRMQHGEEEDKGINVFHVKLPTYKWSHTFIPNPKANLFKTVRPVGDTNDECVSDFLAKVDVLFPEGEFGYIRCMHHSSEVRALIGKVCAKNRPNLIYSHKSTNKVDDSAELRLDDLHLEFDDIKPTIHNLGDLVFQYLHDNKLICESRKDDILRSVNSLLDPC